MTAPNAFLVDSNSTPIPRIGVAVDSTSGAPSLVTYDSGGNQVVTPAGGSGSAPASAISPAAAGTGAVGSAVTYARQDHTHPVSGGVPVPVSGATTLANLAHNGNDLICTGTPALTVNTGLMAGFGCGIKGTFTTTGTATVTDLRATTGTAWCSLVQTAADGSTYDLVGTK